MEKKWLVGTPVKSARIAQWIAQDSERCYRVMPTDAFAVGLVPGACGRSNQSVV